MLPGGLFRSPTVQSFLRTQAPRGSIHMGASLVAMPDPGLHREPGAHSPPFSLHHAAHWTDARDPPSGASVRCPRQHQSPSAAHAYAHGLQNTWRAWCPAAPGWPQTRHQVVGRRSRRGLPLDAGGQAPLPCRRTPSSSLGSQTAGLPQARKAVSRRAAREGTL